MNQDMLHERFTTSKVTSGVTSTAMEAVVCNTMRSLTEEEIRKTMYNEIKNKKKKGYV